MTRTLNDKRISNGRKLALDGAAWRKLRAAVLRDQPICRDCERRGYLTEATEVHHSNGDPSDNCRANLVGLCKGCHSIHTAREMGHTARYGCDASGWPIDPDHHFNDAQRAATQAKDHEVGSATNRPVTRSFLLTPRNPDETS